MPGEFCLVVTMVTLNTAFSRKFGVSHSLGFSFFFSCIYGRVFVSVVGINGRWCCGCFHWYIVCFFIGIDTVIFVFVVVGIDIVLLHWY